MKTGSKWLIALMAGLLSLTACSDGDTASTAVSASDPAGVPANVELPADEPPPDLADLSYVHNLLAKEANGEWTRGEGLVATLGVFAGEADEAEVLRHDELVDYEGTGIIAMARDYLDGGSDGAAKEDIAHLLEQVTFSGDRLDAMAGVGATAALAGFFPAFAADGDSEQDCRIFFRQGAPPGVAQCLEVRTLHVLDVPGEGPYRVFIPAPSLPDGGWTEKDYDLALEAMGDAVVAYSNLEGVRQVKMTPVNLVFSVSPEGYATADPLAGEECGVVLHGELQPFSDVSFKQVVAHELAHCFQTEAFVAQNEVDYEYIQWREEGLAEFFGNVVYPDNNLEWDPIRMNKLANAELKTTLFDRAYTNFMLFQYLHNKGGHPAIFGVVEQLPTINGYEQQKDALGGIPGMFEENQEFMKTVTDEKHKDTSGANGEYAMTETNRPTVNITGTGTVVASRVEPFGVLRRRLVVEPGKQACLTWDETNLLVENSPNPEGEWVPLPTLLPLSVEESGDVDLVVTATERADFALVVASVHDLDEEQDGTILGEWIVDNWSMRNKVGYLAPVQTLSVVSGQIRVTFRDDGTVKLVYSGFRVAGHSEVQMEDGAFSTDMRSTFDSVTDAEGEDSYRVNGDYVFYGSLSEGNFLNGTETVTHTSEGYFLGIDAGDLGIAFEEPEESTDTHPPSGWAFLGAANQLRFACGGNLLLLDDIVLRRAG